MDACEATNILISKIRRIDPENAPKIMGCILLQCLSDSDLVRLASSPEALLRNVVYKVKTHLGLSTSSLSAPPSYPTSPSPLNPISRPTNPFSQTSPRVTGNGSFGDFSRNPSPHSWPLPGLPKGIGNNSGNSSSSSPKSSPFLSYDNIQSGSVFVPPFLKNGGGDSSNSGGDFLDEYQLDEYLSFLDDSSSRNEEAVDPPGQFGGFMVSNGDSHLHRRSFSESDAFLGDGDGGFGIGYRPCMYFARGFCKNGDNCKFVHTGFGGDDAFEGVGGGAGGVLVGSPQEMDGLYLQQHEEMMRMKAAQHQQQQRLSYEKYMNFLLQQRDDHPHRLGTVAAMIGDEFHKVSRFRPERNDFFAMGIADKSNSAARQIYLTFPAESTFKDEDVSNYFSTFGPVQDVRIPYQQKRMFGFVTFVHPETVKLILARGNPHFICDSRVLVKPYKEKGKLAHERQHHLQQQLLERGNFSSCSSSSGFDPRELYDLHFEASMLQDAQEMMLRRKFEEQADLQQAIELQGRRLVNLQLPDLRQDYVHHHQQSLSVGAPISLNAPSFMNQNVICTSNQKNHEAFNDDGSSSAVTISASVVNTVDQNLEPEVNADCIQKSSTIGGKVKTSNSEGCDVQKCCGSKMENVLPDSLFGSPKSSGKQQPDFPPTLPDAEVSLEFSVPPSFENKESVTTNSASDVPSNLL